jgi:outer membrane protein OmpA-like peptidoglycan-associated protein
MAAALLNQISNEFGGETLTRISSAVGESPGKIKTALGDILPALLGGLASKAQTKEGAHELLDVIHQNHLDTEQYEHVGDAIKSPNAMSNLMNTGKPLLDTVLGGRSGAVTDMVASHAGINPTSSKSLMSLALPLVLGLVGRRVGNGGESGLMNVLGKPKAFLQDAPSGIASALGLGGMAGAAGAAGAAGLSSVTGAANTATGAAHSTLSDIGQRAQSYTTERPHRPDAAPAAAAETPAWKKWILPLLVALGLVALFTYFMGQREPAPPAAPAATAPAAPEAPAAPSIAAPTTPAAPSAAAPPDTAPATSGQSGTPEGGATGAALNLPAGSSESKLLAFIRDPSTQATGETWFSLEKVQFETNSATLRPSSQEQLGNVADILKANPQVTLKIGGYTDNTGDPAKNLQLSRDRATNTMKLLVSMGVDQSRLTAEGYGEKSPVADNATEEGRQRNRRIDVSVTKK